MTTARERAREAVGALSVAVIDGRMQLPSSKRCADAASDVWEPIVRDLVEAASVPGSWADWGAALVRAKEALGE